MGSTGEFFTGFTPNAIQSVQNVFVPDGFQAMPEGVPANANGYYQSGFTSNSNATMVTNYMPNSSQHGNVMPVGNPNTVMPIGNPITLMPVGNPTPANYVINTIQSTTSGVGFPPNPFPMSNTVQAPQVTVQGSNPAHGISLAGGNVVQTQTPFQMQQQSYSNYVAPSTGGNTLQLSNCNQVQPNFANYGVPFAGGNVAQLSSPTQVQQVLNPAQVQQTYISYGVPLSGGIGIQSMPELIPSIGIMSNGPPSGNFTPNRVPSISNTVVATCNNTMVANFGNFHNGSFTATDNNYSTGFEPTAGKDPVQYGGPSTWNMGVQNTYQSVGATSQITVFDESQNYSQPNACDPTTLQREWEAYQATLNQEKGKASPDNEVLKQPACLQVYQAPCANFFSTYGCSNGKTCQFSHYAPGGIKPSGFSGPVNDVMTRNGVINLPSIQRKQFPISGIKTKICTRYSSPEGCKFGDKCHYAHGESDLRVPPTHTNAQSGGPPGHIGKLPAITGDSATPFASHTKVTTMYSAEPSPPGVTVTKMIGATSFTKLAVDAAYVGAIIGKGGSHIKQINWESGCKVVVRDHETNPDLRNVEMEGSPDQIEKASELVRQLLQQKDAGVPKAHMVDAHTFKTKLCENYSSGVCTYGEHCLFAHGHHELRIVGR